MITRGKQTAIERSSHRLANIPFSGDLAASFCEEKFLQNVLQPFDHRRSAKISETWHDARIILSQVTIIPFVQTIGEIRMLSWAVTFFIIAIIAAIFGFGGIAGSAAGIAQILFFLFLVLFVISLVARALGGKTPPA
ncbi:MAG: hypothetical protein DHS20C12_00900 [Pseudohongiella sp.]|nr:MAG: hypothetical protein DHS20C12_00900 [Pseudohongiella sp.]